MIPMTTPTTANADLTGLAITDSKASRQELNKASRLPTSWASLPIFM